MSVFLFFFPFFSPWVSGSIEHKNMTDNLYLYINLQLAALLQAELLLVIVLPLHE